MENRLPQTLKKKYENSRVIQKELNYKFQMLIGIADLLSGKIIQFYSNSLQEYLQFN